ARAGIAETAKASGYRRLQSETTILVMDVGRPPPEAFSHAAQAGCLSFELSDRGEKLIGNCGAPPRGRDIPATLARATAAHSTLTINDTSSCHFAPSDEDRWPEGGPVLDGPRRVDVLRESDDASEMITARHDAYAREFGVIHERRLILGRDGGWLIGEDRLKPVSKRRKIADYPVTIRFHLPPSARAESLEPDIVRIILASGSVWTLTSERPAAVEDSILFASQDGMRRTTQIVITSSTKTQTVKWSLARNGALNPEKPDA
ncbi:MAG: heparinase, partial [Betaproteobacteria bacterium]|nr:heparinase [Betaproteobacteria bacterium]